MPPPPPPPSGNKAEADGVDGEGGKGCCRERYPLLPICHFFCKAPSALCEEKEQQHTTKEEGGVATTVGREEVWHLGRKVWNL